MNLETRIRETISKYGLLSPGDGLLMGVSGGPDSVAMFHLMLSLREELGLRLAVAHLIHGLRGEEAREDARFVAHLAEQWAVPFFLKEIDLPQVRLENGRGNMEALARKERYEFFGDVAEGCTFNKVATAHTRDDQAETMIMWFLRGSGRGGLSGISPLRHLKGEGSPSTGLSLVRPLIEASRQEILAYLADRNLDYRTDSSNLDCRFLRNWTRHQLLPQLRERFDDGLSERLAKLATIFRDEEKLLDAMTLKGLQRVGGGENLMVGALLREDKGIQRRVIRKWLDSNTDNLQGMAFSYVEMVLEFMALGPSQGRLSLPKGWDLVKEYDFIRLERSRRKKPVLPCYSYSLPREGSVMVPEAGVRFQSLRSSHVSTDNKPHNAFEAYFDSSSLPEPLMVRNFRTGDRFQPLGMTGHKKVKDLFIEKKIPLSVRRNLPMLVAGDEILWIPRYGRSELAKAGPNAREILKVRIMPLDG